MNEIKQPIVIPSQLKKAAIDNVFSVFVRDLAEKVPLRYALLYQIDPFKKLQILSSIEFKGDNPTIKSIFLVSENEFIVSSAEMDILTQLKFELKDRMDSNGDPMIIDQIDQLSKDVQNFFKKMAVQTLILFPMINKESEVFGVLVLMHGERGAYSQDHLPRVNTVFEQYLPALSYLTHYKTESNFNIFSDDQSASAHTQLIAEYSAKLIQQLNEIHVIIVDRVQLLKDRLNAFLKEEDFKHIKRIVTESERLKHITFQLLAFNQRNILINKRKINPNQMLENIIRFLKPKFQRDNIQLKTKFIQLDDIYADADLITYALLHIFTNAHEALKSTVTKIVSVSSQQRKDTVEIRIRDSGRGIDPELHDYVFQPFFSTKINELITKDAENYGLGLTIGRRIIHAHGGAITISSEPESGTLVVVSLPIQKNKTPLGPQSVDSILVVDDDPIALEVMKSMIRRVGNYAVQTATSRREAMSILMNQSVDLVILDIFLHDESGFDMAKEVSRSYTKTKIILYSAMVCIMDQPGFDDSIIYGFLKKPLRQNELANMILELTF